MVRALVVWSSTDGQTRRICERLRELLRAAGHAASLVAIEDAAQVMPTDFGLVVIGARIRYGNTDPRVIEYANRHAKSLTAMPSAYFSVNLVARKPEKGRPETNPYVQKFLRRVTWRPRCVEVFAGRLDYSRYGLCDRLIIRLIMLMTGGPTATDTRVEYTDWQRVDAFGATLNDLIAARA